MSWKPDYITADDLAAFLRIDDDDDDDELGDAVSAASRAIDDHCRRQFGSVEAEARRYQVRYRCGEYILDIDDLQDATGLTVDGVAIASPDLRPLNAVAKGDAWTRLVLADRPADTVATVVAPWGWTAFPLRVVAASKIQGSRFFKRRDAPFGVAGSPDAGSEVRLLAKVDPDVAVMLRGLRRTAVPR